MKKTTYFLLSLIIAISFSSCEEDEEDLGYTGEQVWNYQFVYGNTQINGYSILTSEVQTTNTFIRDVVCYEALPSGYLQTFSFRVYIPSDEELEAGFETNEFVVFYNNTSVVLDETLSFIEHDFIDGIDYAVFLVEGSFFQDAINRENFQQLRFGFDMIHRDPETQEEYNRDGKFIEINFDPC